MLRRAFTLVELLVTLSLIGTLVSLLLVGVQAVRESSRKAKCQNKMRQCGLALANAQSARSTYPSFVAGYRPLPSFGCSVFNELLPYMESQRIPYETIVSLDETTQPFWHEREISVLSCPSDPITVGTSYRVNLGTSIYSSSAYDEEGAGNGAFDGVLKLRPVDFTRGMSNTVALSERTRSYGNKDYARILASQNTLTTEELLGMGDPRGQSYLHMGWSALVGSWRHTGYSHVRNPNAPSPDTLVCNNPSSNSTCFAALVTARSNHNGGVYSVRMDSSVHFVSAGIDLATWRALGTRSSQ